MRLRIALAGAVLALVAAAASRLAPRSAPEPRGSAAAAPSRRAFPNPLLVSHDGKQVRFYDDLVKDRSVLINFAYTKCSGRCPVATSRLVEVQRRLGDRFGRDVTMVTVSLDPDNDTPEAMKEYVEAHRGRPGWTYVSGSREDLETLRRFLGFTDPDPRVDADRTQHAALVLMGNDRTGRWATLSALVGADQILEALGRATREPARRVASAPAGPGIRP